MGSFHQNDSDILSYDQESDFISAIRHFHAGVCTNCYEKETAGKRLSRCGQCQLVYYCSKACQKNDWPSHRALCVVNKISDLKNVFDTAKTLLESRSTNWLEIRKNLTLAASINLRRSLDVRESEIFYFPKVCEICKDTRTLISASCSICSSAFYCSDLHKIQDEASHKLWCKYYLLCLECESYEAIHGMKDLPFPTDVDSAYIKLPTDMMALLNPQLRVAPNRSLDHRFVAMITERLSYPLSLLYSLENVGVGSDKKDISIVSDLKVHVIGAKSSTELLGIIRWEYLLHRLPALQRFHITFVGPELLASNTSDEEELVDNHCIESSGLTRCENCSEKGRLVIYEMASMLYDEYVESSHYSTPDAIVAFNCGFHEHMQQQNNPWMKSLQLITQSSIPLIFTSYTKEESVKDLQAVLNANESVKIEVPAQENPFKATRPVRCPESESGNLLFFYNQYLTSVRGASKCVVDKP